MNYSEELYWRRIKNLYKAWQIAEHSDFKRIWMDKLQELMKLQSKYLTRDSNSVIIA